ncbi:hypothetical protein FPV67DRAFT_1511284 [Lyophyllum atratum]|nr:hypothetical protein FPV67DRAFT_1511284 [Lyophyllum atratum]
MKFVSTIAAVFLAIPLVAAQGCQPMCCSAVVPSTNPAGQVGLDCTPGGFDCGFSGLVTTCCSRLAPFGARTGTAIGCQ